MPPPTPIVKYLLILNFLVFAIVYLPGELGYNFNVANSLALYYPGGNTFQPYQLVSHFFMHGDITHIAFNMLSLYFLGPIVENRIGSPRFLLLYLAAAIGAAALHSGQIRFDIQNYQDLAAAFNADPSLANLNQFFKHVPTDQLQENGKIVSQIIGKLENQFALGKATPEVIGESYYMMNQSGRMRGALLRPNLVARQAGRATAKRLAAELVAMACPYSATQVARDAAGNAQ